MSNPDGKGSSRATPGMTHYWRF